MNLQFPPETPNRVHQNNNLLTFVPATILEHLEHAPRESGCFGCSHSS